MLTCFVSFINSFASQGLFSWILVFMRVTDEHIRLKCGIDALQYIVFQKHLIVYTVIIFCLSIGIVLPVNYSGKNGEWASHFAPYCSHFGRHGKWEKIVVKITTKVTSFVAVLDAEEILNLNNIPAKISLCSYFEFIIIFWLCIKIWECWSTSLAMIVVSDT